MNSNASAWNNSKQFTETNDYVNFGAIRNYSHNTRPIPQNADPYGRPLITHKQKMPNPNCFTTTSTLFREDAEHSSAINSRRAEAVFGPLKPQIQVQPDVIVISEDHQVGNKEHNYPVQQISASIPGPSNAITPRRPKRQSNKPLPLDYKRLLIGTVEHVIRWYKIARLAELSFLYEAIGTLNNWSTNGGAQLIFLRGELGQVIQGLFYSIDHTFPPLKTGSMFSMIGKMIGSHKMMVIDVTEINSDEERPVKRLSLLCQRILNVASGNSPTKDI